ncbi:pyridoxal kinase PdxY [Propionibacteriaceae bacterium Y2011]|uniref:pyridoxal kinase PdxY n=1 Tax=Microlunatus sp. Y2014 TaxID=3418488 RepID=UPI003B484B28
MKTILSIQSSVSYGHAGNSAAVFPLQRMGVEVWPVPTVNFSNHTGHPTFRGPMMAAADIAEVIRGIDELGVLDRCDAVLSGYQGGDDVGDVILRAAELVKQRNPAAVYCCDPVLGDVVQGFYVRPGIPEFMRDVVVPRADLITPNQFELEFLAGGPVHDITALLAAVDAVRATGPDVVLVTSVALDQTPADRMQLVVVSSAGAWQVTTGHLPIEVSGCGDITAAGFLAHWLETGDVAEAAARIASSVFGLLEVTHRHGTYELQLIEAQDEFVRPSHRFTADRLR